MRNFLAAIRGKTNEGFTLVELMVVVAIIGILSAVAIPNFKRYQAKTKTSEAKLQLSAIYSAEISLQSDYDAFSTCLSDAGYTAPGAGNYYAVGFKADNAATIAIVTTNGGVCTAGNFQFPAYKSVGGYTAPASALGTIATAVVDATGTNFTAGAIGAIDSAFNTAALASQWTIDQDKALTQVNRGY